MPPRIAIARDRATGYDQREAEVIGDGRDEPQELHSRIGGFERRVPLAAEAASTPMRKARDPRRRGMQFAELFSVGEDHKIRLAAQIGITHAIVSTSSTLGHLPARSTWKGCGRSKPT